MRKVKGHPPNYADIVAVMGVQAEMCITYGDAIYADKLLDITPDIEVHEQVHMIQQLKTSPAQWWEKWLANPDFRLQQELEAYRIQYRWACDHMPRPQDRAYMLQYVVDALTRRYKLRIAPTTVMKLMRAA